MFCSSNERSKCCMKSFDKSSSFNLNPGWHYMISWSKNVLAHLYFSPSVIPLGNMALRCRFQLKVDLSHWLRAARISDQISGMQRLKRLLLVRITGIVTECTNCSLNLCYLLTFLFSLYGYMQRNNENPSIILLTLLHSPYVLFWLCMRRWLCESKGFKGRV